MTQLQSSSFERLMVATFAGVDGVVEGDDSEQDLTM